MAQQQLKSVRQLDKVDPVWSRIRDEAEEVARREPELSSFIYSSILHHDRFETAVIHRIAERLDHADVSGELIRQAYADALEDDPSIGDAFRADIVATIDRDPAAHRYIDPLLYFKGFHAIQTHRLAHWLWNKGRKDFALYLQSRSSAVFQTDINPNARIGRGIFLDHATGLVVGETAIDRRRRVDPAWRHARRHRQGERGPSSEDPPRRDDRGGREDSGQYRGRPLRAHRGRLGGAQGGAAQHHRRGRAGAGGRNRRLRGTVARHGPDAVRSGAVGSGISLHLC